MRCCVFFILIISTINSNLLYAVSNNYETIHALRQSIVLGESYFQVTTKNPAAREHFLLGASFLHAFMYDLAINQFQQAQKLDPGFAMSYWGEAMANKHPLWNYEQLTAAKEILARYKKNKDQRILTDKEQHYIHAVEVLFGPGSLHTRDIDYMTIMNQSYKDFPKDSNIGALYALSILGLASDFPNDKSSPEYVIKGRTLIDNLVKKFPKHTGVVHYFLHYHDSSDKAIAKQALPQAKTVLTLMKSSSHMTHMSAHIYRRLGLWNEYILANKTSVDAAEALCIKLNDLPLNACNAENKYHSLEWLQDGYLKTKQFTKADASVDKMASVIAIDPVLVCKRWHYRMWARQVLLSKNWHTMPIDIEELSKANDDLYWSAYTECGALQAASFLAIHNNKPIQNLLKQLDTVIQRTNNLDDPYIKQSCQIAKLEIQAEAAREKGNKSLAEIYVKKALSAQKQLISTEVTPALSFLPAQQYYQEYYLQK
jgi:hypothetical protein